MLYWHLNADKLAPILIYLGNILWGFFYRDVVPGESSPKFEGEKKVFLFTLMMLDCPTILFRISRLGNHMHTNREWNFRTAGYHYLCSPLTSPGAWRVIYRAQRIGEYVFLSYPTTSLRQMGKHPAMSLNLDWYILYHYWYYKKSPDTLRSREIGPIHGVGLLRSVIKSSADRQIACQVPGSRKEVVVFYWVPRLLHNKFFLLSYSPHRIGLRSYFTFETQIRAIGIPP